MQELIEKRLSLFGQSQMFLLEEGDSQIARTLDWWKVYENKTLIKGNQEQPYSLNFAPNGNYGKVNHIEGRVSHKQKDAEQYISSLYVDIDMKDSTFKDLNKLLTATLETIWNDKIPVQFITKSGGGFHLWMFVDEPQRYVVGEKYTSKLAFMQESLADIFDGGCKESHGVQKLMRVPFSKYWKSKPSQSTSLLRVIWGENGITTTEVKTVDDIIIDYKWILNIERIDSFYKNIQKVEVTTKKGDSPLGEIGTAQINTLSIVDVIDKLKKYPREYGGATYEYFLKGNRIQFRINGQLYIPDGYKVNRDTNYVHNFSMTSHPIFERPRGPVFPFLYNYFNKDITLVNKFLTDEYSISIVKGEGSEGMYLCIPTESGYIYFTDKGVFYGKSIFDKKKETYKDVQVKLFDIPIYVKGIIQTNYDLFGETDEKNFFYILYNQKSNEEIIIEFTPDRKAFNKKYGKKGLIFVGDEFDLLDFYNGINKATSIIKEYDLKYLNGYYEDCFIIGDTIYNKYFQPINIDDTNMLLKTQTIAAIKGQTEVSLSTFGERLRKVFSDRQAMTSMTAFIALFLGHKFWVPILQKYKQQVLIPGLFLSGTTKAGKALSASTEIPMADGTFKYIKNITEGDIIISGDGIPTNVLGKYNPNQKETYRVTFKDGDYIDACADHLWQVESNIERTKVEVLSTKQLIDGGVKINNRNHYSIRTAATQYETKDYIINPYTLGAWLGDGSSDSAKIWIKTGDEDIINNIPEQAHLVANEKGCSKYWIKLLTQKLKRLNLINNKHIPDNYLTGSINQRLDLLAGLLDTDGTVSQGHSSAVIFSTSIELLANNVKQLINSLGWTCNITTRIPSYTYKGIKKIGKKEYRISFYPDINVFKLARQNSKLITERRISRKFITSIVPIKKTEEYYCLSVDSRDNTFMCTRNYIKTHNTTLLTMLKNAAGMTYEARKYSIVSTSPQPLKQAATDDFVLHFEEFTGDVGEIKETIVRDILNKARSARGTSDGSNVYYIYRSSVILDGEKLPKSESVANRCIVIPMFDNASDKIGTEKTISEMMGISFLEDLVTQTYNYTPEEVLKLFKISESFLKNNGFSDRNLFLYSFLLTVNKMFNIFFDDELLEAFKENISLHKEIDSQNSVLSNVLADLILKYRSTPTHKVIDKGWMISIPFTQDFKQQNKIMLMDCLKQYPNNIKHLGNTIFIKIGMGTDDSPIEVDKKIYDVVIPYKSYFRTTY